MNNERNNTTAGGIGFCGLLAVAFIVLKLTGVIDAIAPGRDGF